MDLTGKPSQIYHVVVLFILLDVILPDNSIERHVIPTISQSEHIVVLFDDEIQVTIFQQYFRFAFLNCVLPVKQPANICNI